MLYNVTVELDTEDCDGVNAYLADRAFQRYKPVVEPAPDGRVVVALTIEAAYLEQAANSALYLVRCIDVGNCPPFAIQAMPTEEWESRGGAPEIPGMMTAAEAAAALGVSAQRIRQMLHPDHAQLVGVKVGRDWLVSRASVQTRRAELASSNGHAGS